MIDGVNPEYFGRSYYNWKMLSCRILGDAGMVHGSSLGKGTHYLTDVPDIDDCYQYVCASTVNDSVSEHGFSDDVNQKPCVRYPVAGEVWQGKPNGIAHLCRAEVQCVYENNNSLRYYRIDQHAGEELNDGTSMSTFLELYTPPDDVITEYDAEAEHPIQSCDGSNKKDTNPKDAVGIRKAPMSCVSAPVLLEVGVAMMEGALKYGRHNYREAGVRASVYYDANMRHMMSWWEGEDIDAESGISHITKAIAGLTVLRDSMISGNWVDDRPPRINGEWLLDMNEKASILIDKYPNPVPAYTEKS